MDNRERASFIGWPDGSESSVGWRRRVAAPAGWPERAGAPPGTRRTKTFTDPRLCAAIVDRLTFGGNITEIGTNSYRLAHTAAS